MLTEEQLAEIRDRPKDLVKYHNVLVAQTDRRLLLEHIDHLNARLAASKAEQDRLRRGL